MGIKPGDSGMVIGYQIDDFTHTWSAEQFVACFHIYPGLTDKMSSVSHFPLEPGCEDYTFLDQAVADFEQGLNSILTVSIETLEFGTSLDGPHAITSSVSSRSLHLVSTISDTSKLWLVPRIRSHKLWCLARALLSCVSLATKVSASKLIHSSLATLQPLGSGLLHHLITSPLLLPIGRLIRVCLCHFQHGAAHFSPQSCPC